MEAYFPDGEATWLGEGGMGKGGGRTSSTDKVSRDHTRYFPELRSCVKVEVAVQGTPSLIVLVMVSVDVKQH